MTTQTRLARPVTCPSCHTRTLVGELPDGTQIVVTGRALTPPAELMARAVGTRTARAKWQGGAVLNLRTDHEIRVRPAGYPGSRIYAEHHCPKETP